MAGSNEIFFSGSEETRRVVESPEDTIMSGEHSEEDREELQREPEEPQEPEPEEPNEPGGQQGAESSYGFSSIPTDIYGFDFLGEGRPIEPLENQVGQPSDPRGMAFVGFQHSFGYNALKLLDPNHPLSQQHPQISRVFRAQLKAVFDKRGRRNFSLCECHGGSWLDTAGHDEKFQASFSALYQEMKRIPYTQRTTAKIRVLCPSLLERIRIYGILGQGTYGIAFVAREWSGAADRSTNPEQYAIKGQAHKTVINELLINRAFPEMNRFVEPTGEEHFIPAEAIALIYLNNSDRFPTIDSIYVHGLQWALVMRACIDDFPEGRAKIPEQDSFLHDVEGVLRYRLPSFPPFTGKWLTNNDHNVVVSEMEGCKIASQFLEGLVQLNDIRICHGDLSVNNYLVDQDLNVQLIDLGLMTFSPTDEGFQYTVDGVIPFQEYEMRPELAAEYLKFDRLRDLGASDVMPRELYLPNDKRDIALWKFSTLAYGFLHGYWPWELQNLSQNWHGNWDGDYTNEHYPEVKNRRKRMVNEDVTISENLSQDCQDMLQATLARNLEDRPILQELTSFPWFSEWTAAEVESGRPLKRPRVATYAKAQQGGGRLVRRSDIYGGKNT
ncbi:hypothetical protein N7452_008744 [Penicillium brevicompactum]|uniref:EKC/KEOPS complex subunit BUD32 n=1 Tax=Penicillium brevicompactum TaxID=5074 RepID=A0A9W9UAJ1_PENBR|nr:hypothetical protein N7452_008744 [Penicillium brevicompactum]